jgi:hypothetical protein
MNRSLHLAVALVALAAVTGCTKEVTCPAGETVCGNACLDLALDAANCGACGHACAGGFDCRAGTCVALSTDRLNCGAVGRACQPGESCLSGACSSLQVACFASDEVRAVEPLDLTAGSAPRAAGVGPIALAIHGADTWSAGSLSGSLSRLPFDRSTAPTEYLLHGNDFEFVTAHAGRLLISNAGAGTVVIVDPSSGGVVSEIQVGSNARENIKGIAFAAAPGAGEKAFVSLQGDFVSGDQALGQKVAVLDAAGLATCGLAGSPLPCLGAPTSLDLTAGADAPGLPFPGRSLAFGGKVYVVLANLRKICFTDNTKTPPVTSCYWTDPAGPGRLAVIDPAGATGPSVSYLSLGAACGNPGGLAVHGSSIWVACGTGGLVEVALGGPAPVVSGLHVTPGFMVPGNVAFCGDRGFVTDQSSGDVYAFDPVNYAASTTAATTVCPLGVYGYAWAADVACASRPLP